MNRLLTLLAASIIVPGTAIAAQTANLSAGNSKLTNTAASAVQPVEQATASPWASWRITETDWRKYQSLMEGPRGIWSPNASPLSVLGAAASTDAERERYARIEWEIDRIRAEQELAYQRVYNRIRTDWLQKHELPLPSPSSSAAFSSSLIPGKPEQYVLFVDAQKPCQAECRSMLNRSVGSAVQLDIFFIGGVNEDIQRWAANASLSRLAVEQGSITLNKEDGRYKRLYEQSPLPVMFAVSNGRLQVVQ